jgi:hypothetical protein
MLGKGIPHEFTSKNKIIKEAGSALIPQLLGLGVGYAYLSTLTECVKARSWPMI